MAVYSILHQTLQDFEIIIVDDASQDNTQSVIREMEAKDNRIHSLRSTANIGPGAARNMGFATARSKYIAIMDDDDTSLPERLEQQVTALEANPETSLVFSAVNWVNEKGESLQLFPGRVVRGAFPTAPPDIFRLLYLESNKIPNTTIMARRELFERFCYPEHPWIGEDWFLCMQLAASGVVMHAISNPLVNQARQTGREGLMNNDRSNQFNSQRKVLSMIRQWLADQAINEFDSLHQLALANQIIRESRYQVGIKGLILLGKAFLLYPKNPKIRDNFNWYFQKIESKFKPGARKGSTP